MSPLRASKTFAILESRMKPQDLVTVLALARPEPPQTYADLGQLVGLSTSEAHGAVRRLREAGLVDGERRVSRASLSDFLRYGLRVVYPARPGSLTLGVPTGAAVFPDEVDLPAPEAAPWVWPSEHGTLRGLALEPLYRTLPETVPHDPWLYEVLAILDLLRAGQTRDVRWARTALDRRLAGDALRPVGTPAVDLTSPRALGAIFGRRRVAVTAARWLRERRTVLVQHPLTRPILAEYRDELAEHLARAVTDGTHQPEPAIHVVGGKDDGGARDHVYPGIVDTLVARRLIDELEGPLLGGDERAFLTRSRPSSLAAEGDYHRDHAWLRYLASLDEASTGMAIALETDVQEFFGSVDHALARQIVAQRTGAHPAVVQALFETLQRWLPPGRLSARGLPIDPHDVSRIVAHGVLRTVDDDFEDGFDLRYRRYVDDTVMFVDDESDAAHLRERHRRSLSRIGLAPNGAKSRVLSAETLLAERREPHAAEIERARGSAERVRSAWERFGILESRTDVATVRHLLGASSSVDADVWLVERALGHLDDPRTRVAVLHFAREQLLDGAAVDRLRGLVDGDALRPMERLEVLRTLSDAALQAPGDLAVWAFGHLERASADEGAEQAALMLLTYKFATTADMAQLVDWLRGPQITHPLASSTATYLLRALGQPEEARRVATSSDGAWASHLLDDLTSGRVRHPSWLVDTLVRRVRRTRTIRTELLPLLRLLGRTDDKALKAELGQLRTRLEGCTDPAVRRHLNEAMP
ncbi:MAG: RNA-directed DNA polymerase [Myxococcales bacterium]|nr:RNA-directed DNA polymerase [Myxococcales bacterium]